LDVRITQAKARLEDSVTKHMHQNFTRLRLGDTVGAALDWIRSNPPVGRIIYFYVVDDNQSLCGVVPTRRLILSPPERLLGEIAVKQVVTVPAAATVLDACELFIQHRLLALPVVDEKGRVLGVVDMELYTDELTYLDDAQAVEKLFQTVGVHITQGWQGTPGSAFRRRFPWLGCNLAAGILAAFLAGIFKAELNRVVALAFFIPVVLNLAESVSSQSVSLALHALGGQRPTWRTLLGRLSGELATGTLLGAASGAVVGLVALFWLGLPRVSLCLLGGIGGGVAGAAVLGTTLPMLLQPLRLEPRVAAGPVALAGADILTILIYLNLARWLLA
jgi:magnesium transporter